MKIVLPAFAAAFAILCGRLDASPLKGATLSRIVNEVQVSGAHASSHRAAERDVLDADARIHAGAQSRAEVVFADQTLVRLGAETSLSLQPSQREISLESGTLLVQVPAFRGGARIRTGPLAMSCGGATILLEHLPGKSFKAVVLEGEMRVSVARFLGDSIVVPAGKMLITSLDATRIPDPVDTDLRTLVSTSTLIAAGSAANFAPLPSLPRIMRQITRQEDALRTKRLYRTNLVIRGSGTNVIIPSGADANAEAAQESEKTNRRTAETGASLVAGGQSVEEPLLPEP